MDMKKKRFSYLDIIAISFIAAILQVVVDHIDLSWVG
jgi:hypothetical protein